MKTHFKLLVFLCFIVSSGITSAQSETDTEEQIFIHLERARDLKDILDYKEALIHCNNALELAIQTEDQENEATAYRIIGSILLLDNDLEGALLKLNQASKIQSSNHYNEELAITRNVQGLVHTELGNYNQALNYFDSGLQIYRSLQLFSNGTDILKNKGKLYLKKGDFKVANDIFNQAHKDAQKFARESTKAEILLYNSKALNGLDEKFEAIKNCTDAIEMGIANNYPWIITEGYKTLSEIHEDNGNPTKAIKALKTYNSIRDSIYNVRSDRLTQEEIAKLNFADQDRRIEQQNLIIQQKEEKLQQNRILTFLGLAFLILFFSFIVFLINNNQKRKKANLLLQNTNYQLTKAKEEAEKATQTKANFLSTITHELRTPLYTVTGLTDLLLEEDPTDAQKGYLKSLRFSGDYLLNFINDILDVNKIEAQKIELERIPFSLKKLATEVLLTQNKAAVDNNTKLHLNFEDNIPDMVLGDSLRMSQILINLVSNAIKFTKNGAVHLNVTKTQLKDSSIELLIEVKDNGIGISYDKQDEIFESFSQGSVQINRKYGGTGLGLTIVKNLLELMGSKIELRSQPNIGTTFFFTITFPLAQINSTDKLQNNDILPEELSKVLKHKSILLVDDVKVNQLITQKTLMKKGINCTTADNGEMAVEKAKQQKFDLILMDIHMPGIGGIEATKQIREFNSTIPIIALTAITIEKEDLLEFNSTGFNDILSKPFKSDTFFQKIYLQLVK
ncbi:MAG: ATP-binding protein [Flavobacteriaceae bacterium]